MAGDASWAGATPLLPATAARWGSVSPSGQGMRATGLQHVPLTVQGERPGLAHALKILETLRNSEVETSRPHM
eukprot:scaffold7207_cov520-Prasinococcus_capsulatus_cf.AAC.25